MGLKQLAVAALAEYPAKPHTAHSAHNSHGSYISHTTYQAPAYDFASCVDLELLAQIRDLDETLRVIGFHLDWTPDELAGALARRMCMSCEGVVSELAYASTLLANLRTGVSVEVPMAQSFCKPFGLLYPAKKP